MAQAIVHEQQSVGFLADVEAQALQRELIEAEGLTLEEAQRQAQRMLGRLQSYAQLWDTTAWLAGNEDGAQF